MRWKYQDASLETNQSILQNRLNSNKAALRGILGVKVPFFMPVNPRCCLHAPESIAKRISAPQGNSGVLRCDEIDLTFFVDVVSRQVKYLPKEED
jgi:hypothetical protein